MSSERAGVHTSGALNREKARDMVAVRTGHIPTEQMLDALEACVVPDPRIARIEALHTPVQHYVIDQKNRRQPSYQTCSHDRMQWPCETIQALSE